MKTCVNCKNNLNDGDIFCPYCGADNSLQHYNMYSENNNISNIPQSCNLQNYTVPQKQPVSALVVEGIGLLFIIIGVTQLNKTNPIGLIGLIIGAVMLIVSFILFKSYKRKNTVEGLGLAGYIISIIGLVLVIAALVIAVIIIAITYITSLIALKSISPY